MTSPSDVVALLRARNADPLTSHEAAKRVREFDTGHYRRILYALSFFGPMTISEIAARTTIDHVAIARRMSELERDGDAQVLEVDGVPQTRPGKSGRHQRVWTMLKKAEAA